MRLNMFLKRLWHDRVVRGGLLTNDEHSSILLGVRRDARYDDWLRPVGTPAALAV